MSRNRPTRHTAVVACPRTSECQYLRIQFIARKGVTMYYVPRKYPGTPEVSLLELLSTHPPFSTEY